MRPSLNGDLGLTKPSPLVPNICQLTVFLPADVWERPEQAHVLLCDYGMVLRASEVWRMHLWARSWGLASKPPSCDLVGEVGIEVSSSTHYCHAGDVSAHCRLWLTPGGHDLGLLIGKALIM